MQKPSLSKQQDEAQCTPLIRLVTNNPFRRNSAIVKSLQLIFSDLSHDEKLDMLLIKEYRGRNALSLAAFFNCVSVIGTSAKYNKV